MYNINYLMSCYIDIYIYIYSLFVNGITIITGEAGGSREDGNFCRDVWI